MQILTEKNKNYFEKIKYFFPNKEKINEIISYINTNRIATISGMRYGNKTKIIKHILENSGSLKETWYYNQDLDSMQLITNALQLEKLFDIYKSTYGKPKLIVLENVSRIEDIKIFIKKRYEEKSAKILLLGNDLEVEKVPEITTYPLKFEEIQEEKQISSFIYGYIEEINLIEIPEVQSDYLRLIADSIIYNDIVSPYNIKNDKSLKEMLTYLAYNDKEMTIREFHRQLNIHGGDVSLITLGDYISYALNSKIIYNIEAYDLKTKKVITTRNNYFFTDIGIRNALSFFSRNTEQNTHNIIASELLKKGYTLNTGVFGRYEFALIAEKNNERIFIDILNTEKTENLDKYARKMRKAAKYGAARGYFVLTGEQEIIPKSAETIECFSLENILKIFK